MVQLAYLFYFRTEKLESEMILKTKNMRMKEQNRYKSNYKYCLIRVKFPDCLILQVNFYLLEFILRFGYA